MEVATRETMEETHTTRDEIHQDTSEEEKNRRNEIKTAWDINIWFNFLDFLSRAAAKLK